MSRDTHPKIVILSWEYYPIYAGGLGVLVQSVARELIAQGRNVEVWIPHNTKDNEVDDCVISLSRRKDYFERKKSIVPNVNLPLAFKPKKKRKKVWPRLFSHAKKNTKAPSALYRPLKLAGDTMAFAYAVQEKLAKEKEPVVLISMDWHSVPAMSLVKESHPEIKQAFYVNSTEYDRAPRKPNKKVEHAEQIGFDIADVVVAISDVCREIMIKHFEIDEKKIHVAYDDLEFDPEIINYHQINSGKNILFIGRLTAQKGLKFLFEAARQIKDIDPQIRFIIAGDGDLTPGLVEMVAEYGLEKTVIFTGFVNTEEKKLLYRSSDIFVMPSPSEPFGLTALEAIHSGVPVIAAQNVGFVGVVPSTPTFEYYDSGKFMEMLLYYINNSDERGSLLKHQQKDLESHSWSQQIESLLEVIDNVKVKKSL